MKKGLFLFVLFANLLAFRVSAIPACPRPQQMLQPVDGTMLTVVQHGDEFYHFLTTADGYTLLRRDGDGTLVYATRSDDGTLVASQVVAHDLNVRDAAERHFTATLTPGLTDVKGVTMAKQAKARRDERAKANRPFDFSKFRGLVVLVNYNDQQFSRSDANEFYTHMLNDANYTGFRNEDGSANPYGECTGSVRDYFYDNSNGEFAPQFDVVGPIGMTDYVINDGGSRSYEMFLAVLDSIDNDIDFSVYDNDGNGMVDMVYFIVPGSGANSDGENPDHLWPYKSAFWWDVKHDGKRFGAYACSTEFLYNERYGVLDGIGVICHEFSHVLGLPDLYDTDYGDSNGQSHDPGAWEVMAGGGYGNNSRTPVSYSLYDRYALGFATPQVITETGSYSMRPTGTTGDGFILLTPNNKEKFLLENRQKSAKWDATIPGNGMIIARMDSTNANVWRENTINCNPNHNYYELLRAGGSTSGAVASDAFPGTKAVTRVTNVTTANLKTWSGLGNQFSINNIALFGDAVTFDIVEADSEQRDIEDFEPMPVTTDLKATDVQGSLTTWTFNQSYVAEPGAAYSNGKHAVAMVYPSAVYMSAPLRYDAYLVSFDVVNPTEVQAKFTCTYSLNGTKWTALKVNGTENTVAAGETATIMFTAPTTTDPVYYRINMTGGSKTVPCYIDDFTIYYTEAFRTLTGDVNADDAVNAGDVSAVYNVMLGLETDADIISRADVNDDGSVNAGDVSAIYEIMTKE